MENCLPLGIPYVKIRLILSGFRIFRSVYAERSCCAQTNLSDLHSIHGMIERGTVRFIDGRNGNRGGMIIYYYSGPLSVAIK